MSVTSEEAAAVFDHPDFPWANGGGDERLVEVSVAVQFAEQLGCRSADLAADLEDWVTGVGGRRLKMVDPWNWMARKLGRATKRSGDVFEVPRAATT